LTSRSGAELDARCAAAFVVDGVVPAVAPAAAVGALAGAAASAPGVPVATRSSWLAARTLRRGVPWAASADGSAAVAAGGGTAGASGAGAAAPPKPSLVAAPGGAATRLGLRRTVFFLRGRPSCAGAPGSSVASTVACAPLVAAAAGGTVSTTVARARVPFLLRRGGDAASGACRTGD
jgi:hypothetical protein